MNLMQFSIIRNNSHLHYSEQGFWGAKRLITRVLKRRYAEQEQASSKKSKPKEQ